MSFEFVDGKEFKDLPVGTHSPCMLAELKRVEPSEENLAKWPDLKPSWAFKFVLWKPGDENHEGSSVRFCNDTPNKQGHLYLFVVDLLGGKEPEKFEPDELVGSWFSIKVRKKAHGERLHVAGVDPMEPPADAAAADAALLKQEDRLAF